MIDFVGAGPGAVDLITVRGMRALQQADVVVYAGSLVDPEMLAYCRPEVKVHDSAHMTLEEVVNVLVASDRAGKRTVRLHTGDPAMYGAIREQMDLLDEAGVTYRVIPGVSSVFAAAAALNCEFTLPSVSQSLVLTRVEGRTPVPSGEELRTFAAHGCTIALFLSCGLLERAREELLTGGLSPQTPAALVYRASWPDQKIVRCDVGSLPEAAREAGLSRQAIVLVGDALAGSLKAARAKRSLLYDPSFTHGYRVGTGGDETLAGSTDARLAAQDETQGMQGTQDLRDPHDEAHA